ncbi:gamma-glutamyltransferase, partial [Enterococcus faecium]|uniref:gamma-glutamyltransferase n=1 Tax=Enterococcus faecium TaxID=1352 RepID=UPI003F4247D8
AGASIQSGASASTASSRRPSVTSGRTSASSAAAAGAAILKAGGTATDAAIATMLALGVVEPQSSGLGGGSYWVRHSARTGKVDAI